MKRHKQRYEYLVKKLAPTHPRVARLLSTAHKNRLERLELYFSGARLRGLEELLSYLETAEQSCLQHKRLKKISLLIARVRADFETALEATLSGFHSVVFDAMRDVMEAELLLTDFGIEPKHIDEWLNADERTRQKRFSPAVLRKRHGILAGLSPQDVPGYRDYKSHSVFLHVTPRQNPLGDKGLVTGQEPFGADSCFWDIFEHARTIVFLIHAVRKRLAPRAKRGPHPSTGLPKVRDAWRSTQEVNELFLLLLEQANGEERALPPSPPAPLPEGEG